MTGRRLILITLAAVLVFASAGVLIGLFDPLGVSDATREISTLPNHAWDAASEGNPADNVPSASSIVGRAVASLILLFLKAVNWAL